MTGDGFRAGDLVRVVRGPGAGKVARISGFGTGFPDFAGDPSRVYAQLAGDWAPEFPPQRRVSGVFRLRDLELAAPDAREDDEDG